MVKSWLICSLKDLMVIGGGLVITSKAEQVKLGRGLVRLSAHFPSNRTLVLKGIAGGVCSLGSTELSILKMTGMSWSILSN